MVASVIPAPANWPGASTGTSSWRAEARPGWDEAAAALRRDFGVKVTTLPLDTSSLRSVRDAAANVGRLLDSGEIGSLDALLCNAGGRFDGPVCLFGGWL